VEAGIESVPRKRFDGMLRPAEHAVNGVPHSEGGAHARMRDRRISRFGAR
jgi:hypothetical protein